MAVLVRCAVPPSRQSWTPLPRSLRCWETPRFYSFALGRYVCFSALQKQLSLQDLVIYVRSMVFTRRRECFGWIWGYCTWKLKNWHYSKELHNWAVNSRTFVHMWCLNSANIVWGQSFFVILIKALYRCASPSHYSSPDPLSLNHDSCNYLIATCHARNRPGILFWNGKLAFLWSVAIRGRRRGPQPHYYITGPLSSQTVASQFHGRWGNCGCSARGHPHVPGPCHHWRNSRWVNLFFCCHLKGFRVSPGELFLWPSKAVLPSLYDISYINKDVI